MKRTVLISLLMVTLGALGAAQTAPDEFDRGNVFYREGKFDQAAAAYEAILKQGSASSSVFFNLGNAYYRMGKVAPAILAFERALRLEPNDPDIKHNLSLVNLKTADRIEPLPEVFFVQWLRAISGVVSLQTTAWLFGAAWALLFLGLASLYLINQISFLKLGRMIVLGAFIALVPLTALMIAQISDSRSHDEAIITATVVTAKTSPDAQSVDAFVVHEGLRVELRDYLGEWVKIVLADGKVGWVRSIECERI